MNQYWYKQVNTCKKNGEQSNTIAKTQQTITKPQNTLNNTQNPPESTKGWQAKLVFPSVTPTNSCKHILDEPAVSKVQDGMRINSRCDYVMPIENVLMHSNQIK